MKTVQVLTKGLLAAMCGILLVSPLAAQRDPDVVPFQYIVVLKDDTSSPRALASELARQHGLGLLHVYEHALKGFAATVPNGGLNALRSDPRVDFISEDRLVFAFDTPPTGVNRINAERPYGANNNTGLGVNVAVIDTGVDLDHPGLAPNIHSSLGKNCVNTSLPDDDNGHGSHVAGIIAAIDGNNDAVVGVAKDAKIVPVKVLDAQGSGTWGGVICGIDYVTLNAASIKVANMSLGGSGSDSPSAADCTNSNGDALHMAICRSVQAGVTYAVAAGNGNFLGRPQDLKKFVPAAYDEVITVTALADSNGAACGGGPSTSYGGDDKFASFTNYATLSLDLNRLLAAPGVNIYSTYKNGGYATLSGTSMAAPHVAGAAALYIYAHPGASPSTVRTDLRAAGEPKNVNFTVDGVADCGASVSSHTDSSGKHPEPVVRADKL